MEETEVGLDSNGEVEWNIERVKADLVWEMGIDGTGAVVGSLDSGVDWTDPALRDKWRGYDPVTGETIHQRAGLTQYMEQVYQQIQIATEPT